MTDDVKSHDFEIGDIVELDRRVFLPDWLTPNDTIVGVQLKYGTHYKVTSFNGSDDILVDHKQPSWNYRRFKLVSRAPKQLKNKVSVLVSKKENLEVAQVNFVVSRGPIVIAQFNRKEHAEMFLNEVKSLQIGFYEMREVVND